MIITTSFNGVFISTKTTTSTDKDGRPIYNDYIAIESNNEVGNVLCTTQVKKDLQEIPKYTKLEFEARLDTWNKTIIVGAFTEI